MKRFLLFTLFAILVVAAGNISNAQSIPEEYISVALANNLTLKEKTVSLEKSLIALKEARSMFLPTTWFEGQYTLAKGGRSIDIPVGDLVNPIYKTLNQLTGSDKFHSIQNVSEQFAPNNFYDVRIKTTMPLFNPEIGIGRDIKKQQILLQQSEVDIYKRELIKDVKTAYYNYLSADKAIEIFKNALEIVNQNLKINQSLLKNGKGLPAYVSRAESEVKTVESQLQTAINEKQNAKAYFNFLLNKPLDEAIIGSDPGLPEFILSVSDSAAGAINTREELRSLYTAKEINRNILKMNQSYRKPRLNAFLDLAAQGFDFNVNNKSFFYLGGLQLQIPIFSGNRNQLKIQQSRLDLKSLDMQTVNTKQQLELATVVSRNNTITAYHNYLASLKQQEAAQKYFKLIDRGFFEGINTFIEFLDARNQVTNAALLVNINQFKVLAAAADYERQTASYLFN